MALSSTDKRQITRLSSCHLRNRKKPFRVSPDSGRRTDAGRPLDFVLPFAKVSRKLGRVKSSFHGPHVDRERANRRPRKYVRSAFDFTPHTRSRKIRFSTFRFFRCLLRRTFAKNRRLSLLSSSPCVCFFFKVMRKTTMKTGNRRSSVGATIVSVFSICKPRALHYQLRS